MNEVLINHMFSGDYLETGNLGYEVINLFKCDNGHHYIYAMSAGDYDTKSHNNSIKKVILVRNVDQHKAEILGICDVEEEIFASEVDEPNKYMKFPSVNELINKDFMNQQPRRKASGYVVLIRWLQSALIPFVTTQSCGVFNHPHE